MDDQTKRLRGGAVEVCPECDIAGCRHIRARAALAAQPAASAEPSDEQIDMVFSMYGWSTDDGRELRPEMWREAVRMLLSRYGRPAGKCFYVDAGPAPKGEPVAVVDRAYIGNIKWTAMGALRAPSMPDGTELYAAPVAAQKADDARDAERYRWLRVQPFEVWKRIAWNTWDDDPTVATQRDADIDAAIAQQRQEGQP